MNTKIYSSKYNISHLNAKIYFAKFRFAKYVTIEPFSHKNLFCKYFCPLKLVPLRYFNNLNEVRVQYKFISKNKKNKEEKLEMEMEKDIDEKEGLMSADSDGRTPSVVEELSSFIDDQYEQMDRTDGYVNS